MFNEAFWFVYLVNAVGALAKFLSLTAVVSLVMSISGVGMATVFAQSTHKSDQLAVQNVKKMLRYCPFDSFIYMYTISASVLRRSRPIYRNRNRD